jgi:small-conductance mechanosensitive channel
MTESPPAPIEGGAESPPEFDRVADVLGPLEQIVLAADQRLGTIQQQVATQASETNLDVERRVRETAAEQRRQVAELRRALTERVSELAGRFDALLSVLDDADRALAIASGEPAGEVRVSAPEHQQLGAPHEQPTEEATAAVPAQGPPPSAAATDQANEPRKEKGIRRFFRRPSKRASA